MAEGPSEETIQQAIADWVALATGIPTANIRIGGSGGVQSVLPRAWITPVSPGTAQGRGEDVVDEDGGLTVVDHYRASYDLNVVVAGPEHEFWTAGGQLHTADYAKRLRAALRIGSKQAPLAAAGIAVVDLSAPRDMTAAVDTRFEERASIEITVAYRYTSATDTDGDELLESVRGDVVVGTVPVTVDAP